MLSRSRYWIALLAASSWLAAGCRVGQGLEPATLNGSGATAPAASAIPERDRVEAHARYGAGIVLELNGEPEQALEEFYQAALKDPANETLVLDVSRRFLQQKQPEKALELLTRATAQPGAAGALYARLGFIYSSLGKPEQAVKADRMAIKRAPQSLAGYQNLYITHLQNKQEPEALAALDEAAKVPRTDAAFLIGLAELYANLGLQMPAQKQAAFARAAAVLQRAEKLDAREPSLRLRLADGFNLLGQEEKAAQIYAELLESPLDLPYIRDNIRAKLTDIYLREQNRTNAVTQLEAIIRDHPTDVQAYYLLGSIAYDSTNYPMAMECFGKVLLLKPDSEVVYYDLARAQISGDQVAAALATLGQARQKFSQSFILEYLTGMAYVHGKDYTNALQGFSAAEIFALGRDTNNLTDAFYFQYGATCERVGDIAQAEAYFQKCLQRSPDHSEALNYLGYMWVERGEKLEQAREMIARALKAEPRNEAYLDSMGWVLFKLRQPQEALEYLLRAIQYSAEPDATLYDHLGDIYAALGRVEKAREAWQKSLSIEPSDPVRKKIEPAAP